MTDRVQTTSSEEDDNFVVRVINELNQFFFDGQGHLLSRSVLRLSYCLSFCHKYVQNFANKISNSGVTSHIHMIDVEFFAYLSIDNLHTFINRLPRWVCHNNRIKVIVGDIPEIFMLLLLLMESRNILTSWDDAQIYWNELLFIFILWLTA